MDAASEVNANGGVSLAQINGAAAASFQDASPLYDLKFVRSGTPPTNTFVQWIAVEP